MLLTKCDIISTDNVVTSSTYVQTNLCITVVKSSLSVSRITFNNSEKFQIPELKLTSFVIYD